MEEIVSEMVETLTWSRKFFKHHIPTFPLSCRRIYLRWRD